MGTYGVVFFEQLLGLWVVSITVFIVGSASLRGRVLRRAGWWALVLPGAQRLEPGQRGVAVLVVALVMAASYLVGTLNPRLLTCDDFTISGNFAPPGCTPGVGTTER